MVCLILRVCLAFGASSALASICWAQESAKAGRFSRTEIIQMNTWGVRAAVPPDREPKPIPIDIEPEKLTAAEALDFTNKPLFETPAWLGKFAKLRALMMARTNVDAGSVVAVAGSLSELEFLDLSDNKLFERQGSLDKLWPNLPHLRTLRLARTGGRTNNLGSMSSLHHLTELDLSHNAINDIKQLGLAGLPVRRLSLAHNPLNQTLDFKALPTGTLVELDISHAGLREVPFIDLPNLVSWKLGGNVSVSLAPQYGSIFAMRSLANLEVDSNIKVPDGLHWKLARARDTIAAYEGYLRDWPLGAFAEEAKKRLSELRDVQQKSEEASRSERERQAARKARETDTIEGYEQYLKEFPSGASSKQLRDRLAELRYTKQQGERRERETAAARKARELDTIEAYEGYLRDWPSGALSQEIRRRLTELRTLQADRHRVEERERAERERRSVEEAKRREAEEERRQQEERERELRSRRYAATAVGRDEATRRVFAVSFVNQQSMGEAVSKALGRCRQEVSNCQIVARFAGPGRCVFVASGRTVTRMPGRVRTSFGTRTAGTEGEALQKCRSDFETCHVFHTRCNSSE